MKDNNKENKTLYDYLIEGHRCIASYNAGGDSLNDYSIVIEKEENEIARTYDYNVLENILSVVNKEINEVSGDEYQGESVTIYLTLDKKRLQADVNVIEELRVSFSKNIDVTINPELTEGAIDYIYNSLIYSGKDKPGHIWNSILERDGEVIAAFNSTICYVLALQNKTNKKDEIGHMSLSYEELDDINTVIVSDENINNFENEIFKDKGYDIDTVEIQQYVNLKKNHVSFLIDKYGTTTEDVSYQVSYDKEEDPEEYEEKIQKLKETNI